MDGIIVYGFIIGGLFCLAALGVIMWLNSRESDLDRISYDDSFDPGDMVSSYRSSQLTDEDGFDPEKTLGRYAEHLYDKPRRPRKESKPDNRAAVEQDNAEVTRNSDKKTKD